MLYAGVMLTSNGPSCSSTTSASATPRPRSWFRSTVTDCSNSCERVGQGRLYEHASPPTAPRSPSSSRATATPRVNVEVTSSRASVTTGNSDPVDGVVVFHAGTARDEQGRFVTNGGRVVAITAVAPSIGEARQRAYAGAALVSFDGVVARSDIAGDMN